MRPRVHASTRVFVAERNLENIRIEYSQAVIAHWNCGVAMTIARLEAKFNFRVNLAKSLAIHGREQSFWFVVMTFHRDRWMTAQKELIDAKAGDTSHRYQKIDYSTNIQGGLSIH